MRISQTFSRRAMSYHMSVDCFGEKPKGEFMKQIFSLTLSAVFILGLGVAAFANTPYVDRREHREQQRIRQGIRSGELTRRETRRLETEQGRIRGYEWYAKSDGHVSRAERRHLDRMLDRSSRDIYRQKHDGQDRLP
jgi:hypothetical protein